ncbi:hypothetical protein TSAR_006305 [Trichomalopsis sarcophagae]|uniref:Uncharacterized protein n=1 Tax=Trichomalopsis sarcophagae TaxID=543379 RepID=A0A232EKJ5_9HYME|nr:hypothetical protein TSAR_006305 [Trichomalopsis sarcophagae]
MPRNFYSTKMSSVPYMCLWLTFSKTDCRVLVYTYTMHRSNVYRKSAVDLLLQFVKASATKQQILIVRWKLNSLAN